MCVTSGSCNGDGGAAMDLNAGEAPAPFSSILITAAAGGGVSGLRASDHATTATRPVIASAIPAACADMALLQPELVARRRGVAERRRIEHEPLRGKRQS